MAKTLAKSRNVETSLYSPVQKVITLRDLQKVFSDVEHWSIQQGFTLKRNNNIQNDGNKWGICFQRY